MYSITLKRSTFLRLCMRSKNTGLIFLKQKQIAKNVLNKSILYEKNVSYLVLQFLKYDKK